VAIENIGLDGIDIDSRKRFEPPALPEGHPYGGRFSSAAVGGQRGGDMRAYETGCSCHADVHCARAREWRAFEDRLKGLSQAAKAALGGAMVCSIERPTAGP
jgi:hypothetical protein